MKQILATLSLLFLSACMTMQPRPATTFELPIKGDKTKAYTHAAQVLTQQGFHIDHSDPVLGIITASKPIVIKRGVMQIGYPAQVQAQIVLGDGKASANIHYQCNYSGYGQAVDCPTTDKDADAAIKDIEPALRNDIEKALSPS